MISALYHMVIGNDIAVGTDEYTAAGSFLWLHNGGGAIAKALAKEFP